MLVHSLGLVMASLWIVLTSLNNANGLPVDTIDWPKNANGQPRNANSSPMVNIEYRLH